MDSVAENGCDKNLVDILRADANLIYLLFRYEVFVEIKS
jgi:hypothetical protein